MMLRVMLLKGVACMVNILYAHVACEASVRWPLLCSSP